MTNENFTPPMRGIKPVKIRGIECLTPAQVLDVYLPTKRLRPLWLKHGAFIKRSVFLAKPVSPTTTKNMLSATTLFVESCIEQSYEIDAETIFTPDVVDYYIGQLMTTKSIENRATRRSMFKKIGLATTSKAPWIPPSPTIPKRKLVPSYTESELDAMEKAARNQATQRQRQAMLAVLYLCLGAGARAGEVPFIRPEHIHTRGARLYVDIPGPRARTVPVQRKIATKLRKLMNDVTTTYAMGNLSPFRHDPIGAHLQHTVMPAWAPTINASRLRTTWLVRLLNSNVRLSEITAAAGVKQLYAIEAVLPQVRVRDNADAYLAGEK